MQLVPRILKCMIVHYFFTVGGWPQIVGMRRQIWNQSGLSIQKCDQLNLQDSANSRTNATLSPKPWRFPSVTAGNLQASRIANSYCISCTTFWRLLHSSNTDHCDHAQIQKRRSGCKGMMSQLQSVIFLAKLVGNILWEGFGIAERRAHFWGAKHGSDHSPYCCVWLWQRSHLCLSEACSRTSVGCCLTRARYAWWTRRGRPGRQQKMRAIACHRNAGGQGSL